MMQNCTSNVFQYKLVSNLDKILARFVYNCKIECCENSLIRIQGRNCEGKTSPSENLKCGDKPQFFVWCQPKKLL